MQAIYFTLTAIALYFVADWILNQIEIRRGERLPNRSVIFFAIILALSLVSFSTIQYFAGNRGDVTDDSTASGRVGSHPPQ